MAPKVPVWTPEEYLLDRYRTGDPRPLFGHCEAEKMRLRTTRSRLQYQVFFGRGNKMGALAGSRQSTDRAYPFLESLSFTCELGPRREPVSRTSEECAQSIHGFLRALLHQPMSGVLQNNDLNVGCYELHLRPEDCRACPFPSN
jgi:hypothetical protein